MKRIILSIIFVIIAMASLAQDKPGWIYNKPKPTNNSYLYVIESATGKTELAARNQAFAKVLQSTAMRLGQPINSDEISKAVQNGTTFEVISAQYNIPINQEMYLYRLKERHSSMAINCIRRLAFT